MLALRTVLRDVLSSGSSLGQCSSSSSAGALVVASFRVLSAAAAQEPPTLVAELRGSAGTIASNKLRHSGKTPGIIFSGPGGEQHLLAFESKSLARLVTKLGRTGWACSVFNLQIEHEGGSSQAVRALGRQVHMRADTDLIENVTFIYCPPERQVRVDVPLKVIGDEVSPGIKAGGRVNWIKRTIPCISRGDSIPSDFTVDVSKMGMNDKLSFTDLVLPEGTRLHPSVDAALPILKVAK